MMRAMSVVIFSLLMNLGVRMFSHVRERAYICVRGLPFLDATGYVWKEEIV